MATSKRPRVRPWKGWSMVWLPTGEIMLGSLSAKKDYLRRYVPFPYNKERWLPIRVEIRPVRPKRKK